jgi:hypothetical protein
MLRTAIGTLFLAAFVLTGSANAQRPPGPRPPEFLKVSNPSAQTIWVYLKALGGDNPDQQWQPVVAVAQNSATKIRLRGLQPFDILVLKQDGAYTYIRGANLCWIIDGCYSGKEVAELDATGGTWSIDQSGKTVLSPDPALNRKVVAYADYTTVTLPISPVVMPAKPFPPDPKPLPKPTPKPQPKP